MEIGLEKVLENTFATEGDRELGQTIIQELMMWEEVIADPFLDIPINRYFRRLGVNYVPLQFKPTHHVPWALVNVAKKWYFCKLNEEPDLTLERNATEVLDSYLGRKNVLMALHRMWKGLREDAPEIAEYRAEHGDNYQLLFEKMRNRG